MLLKIKVRAQFGPCDLSGYGLGTLQETFRQRVVADVEALADVLVAVTNHAFNGQLRALVGRPRQHGFQLRIAGRDAPVSVASNFHVFLHWSDGEVIGASCPAISGTVP